MKIKFQQWYNEFHSGIRWKDKLTFFINDYPVFAWRIYMNDSHSEKEWKSHSFGFLGFTIIF